jgi:hypothetical protein
MTASRALLVKADGGDEELVLKVASETAHNDRLVAEGEVLSRLRYPNVVRSAYRRLVKACHPDRIDKSLDIAFQELANKKLQELNAEALRGI